VSRSDELAHQSQTVLIAECEEHARETRWREWTTMVLAPRLENLIEQEPLKRCFNSTKKKTQW
jgi:hypothetical protein